jgi:hypothetical protein
LKPVYHFKAQGLGGHRAVSSYGSTAFNLYSPTTTAAPSPAPAATRTRGPSTAPPPPRSSAVTPPGCQVGYVCVLFYYCHVDLLAVSRWCFDCKIITRCKVPALPRTPSRAGAAAPRGRSPGCTARCRSTPPCRSPCAPGGRCRRVRWVCVSRWGDDGLE